MYQDAELQAFAQQHHLSGLSEHTLDAIHHHRPHYDVDTGHRFLDFQQRLERDLLHHPVITHNPYTRWFAQGHASTEQIRAFIVQFSVFSNLFLVAQLHKMINADTLEGMRASKEILANEIGVIFKPTEQGSVTSEGPDTVGTQGSVEGGTFHFQAAHFEWLFDISKRLGLAFHEIGRRRFGSTETLHFCDELRRLYGSDDYGVSQAASYAVENWAAAGFWDELVQGFEHYNRQHATQLPVGFFLWHSQLEGQHAEHTLEELEEYYFETGFDEAAFIQDGNTMLDGVYTFWEGLDRQRRKIAPLEHH